MVVLNRRALGRTVALVVLASATVMTSASPGQAPARRVIEVTAERFEFWPTEITIERGEEVEIRIRSEDTSHGFRIVGAGTNVVVPKRGKGQAVAVFRAERPGRYTFECSRMCGAGHNFMRGVLIVREPSSAGSP
jgi:cytochrome c oxidase subunit 2